MPNLLFAAAALFLQRHDHGAAGPLAVVARLEFHFQFADHRSRRSEPQHSHLLEKRMVSHGNPVDLVVGSEISKIPDEGSAAFATLYGIVDGQGIAFGMRFLDAESPLTSVECVRVVGEGH